MLLVCGDFMKEDVIKLITLVIKGENKKLDIDFSSVFKILKFHHLEVYLYYAWKLGIVDIDDEQLNILKQVYMKNLYKTATQEEELKLIKTSLKDNNIMMLPLKGAVIRSIYPSIDLRTMADIDILVKVSDLKNVRKIMENLGYRNTSHGGNHDVYYKDPFMNVEIHRAMMDESYEMSKYYEDIWDKVIINDKESFLSDDDLYIYIVSHAAKHYLSGGTGIRSVLDIYLLNLKYKLNFNYINQEFKKLNISKFASNIRSLGEAWFNELQLYDSLLKMEEYILSSGVYGTHTHQIVKGFDNPNDSKISVGLKKAFPSFKVMKKIFPSLKYFFILLPFYYIFRIIRGMFRGNVQNQLKTLKKLEKKDIISKKEIVEDMKND